MDEIAFNTILATVALKTEIKNTIGVFYLVIAEFFATQNIGGVKEHVVLL